MGLTDDEARTADRYPELGDPRGSHNQRTVHRFIGEVLASHDEDADATDPDAFVAACLEGLAEEAQAAAEHVRQEGRA